MMPPAYVKPYVRRQKNDAADAAGICEAVTRPSMRFVGVRTLENQAALMHHKAREMLVAQRTQLINALRGHLAEIGVIAAQGLKNARELATVIMAEATRRSLPVVRAALAPLVRQLHALDQEIARSDRTIAAMARNDETARRLMTIPGLGPMTASAMVASVQDASAFSGPREFAAFLGLTPRQNSSGGKAAAGPRLEDGQSLFAEIARRGRACGPLSSQAARRRAAVLGEEAHADQALQACRRRARQQNGAHRLRDHARQNNYNAAPA